jgi:tripartite-type tricarboxylate transporter receptor subunit TctC
MKRLVAAAVLLLLSAAALGQAFPVRPVRLVVGFTPGGGVDINARLLAAKLAELFGQQVIVDNKPGAGTNIANEHVAKAAPDGYTLLFNSSAFAINLALYRNPPYALRDFAGVSVFSESVNLLVVSSSLPARSVQDLVALARARPGALNYSSAGAGTSQHLAAELFKLRTGTDIVHVPYKGSAPALQDLLAGSTQIMFDNMPSAWPHVKAGRLRALGVTGPARNKAAPDVPAIAEFVPGYKVEVWMGYGGPAGLPASIVEKLSLAGLKALEDPGIIAKFAELGAGPWPMTPDALAKRVVSEIAVWAPIVKASGAKVDG